MRRHASAALLLVLLLLLCGLRGAAAAIEDEPACRCAASEACYHWLNAPVPAPDPECSCATCTPRARHPGDEPPAGWNPECWSRKDMDCFLKRHAASWRFTCSACIENTACCRQPHPEWCPSCGEDGKSPWRKDAAQSSAERVAVERKHFDRATPVTIVARHVYVVTDAGPVRVFRGDGTGRLLSTHEYAHLLAMRGELARREFAEAVGSPASSSPVGVFVPKDETTARRLKATYFRHPKAPMIYAGYGSASQSAISEGFCMNGFCFSLDRGGSDGDFAVHQAMRHYLANIFFTNWIVTNGEPRTTPSWAFEGLAHWFGKRPGGSLADNQVLCAGETNEVEGPNKGWATRLARMAASNDLRPAGQMVDLLNLDELTFRDHLQLWGWFTAAMEDVRRPWVQMLGDLRKKVPAQEAFRKRLGWTPEEFQKRWVQRVLGQRKSLLDGPAADPAAATATSASSLDGSPREVAARLKALGDFAEPAVARRLFDLIGGTSELLRETALVAFVKSRRPEVRETAWTYGLVHTRPIVRAYAARACRMMRLAGARDALRKTVLDDHWLVRSEAALALAEIGDFEAQARVREMAASDTSPKARIGAMDALRTFGADANRLCVPPLAANLSHDAWQVRVAACQALAVVGDARAVGPLVERMQLEGGRVADEIRTALRALTYDDLGTNPGAWLAWWEKEKARALKEGFTAPKAGTSETRYAREPPREVFGIENWSSRVGFVVDVSSSTHHAFTPDPDTSRRLFGNVRTTTVQKVMQAEVALALRKLDTRAHFSVWAFNDSVTRWKNGLERASRDDVESAIQFLEAQPGRGDTNFHAALGRVLAMEDEDGLSSQFRDTPDTVMFVTDGLATAGEITEAEVIASWYAGLNRYARILTNTIAIGTLGVDETLLGKLARGSGGRFVQVREFEPK